MTPAYNRSIAGMPRKRSGRRRLGQNIPKNANDHEQVARVHPAQPSYFVVVPAMEPGGSVNIAVVRDIGASAAFRKGLARNRRQDGGNMVNAMIPASWSTWAGLTTLKPQIPAPSRARRSGEQSPRLQILGQIRPHLHRHRRLDLRALARRVLPGKTRASEGAAIRGVQAHLD